jgi:hypothetical protein
VRWFAILLLGFFASMTLAALLYPGGTWFDAGSVGFSFWGNFWCDLLHSPALNAAPNERGALAARVSFWLFAAALLRFWPLAARLCAHPGVRRWVHALGLAGALALVFVTLFSSRDEPTLHGTFVVTSALLGVIAASVLALAIFARASLLTRVLSLALIATAGVSLAQYVRQGAGAEPVEWLAGAQKITTFALLAFMLRCAWLVRDARAAERAAARGLRPDRS